MKYRIVIDESSKPFRYVVQHSIYGHTWATDGEHSDPFSAKRHIASLVKPVRVLEEIEVE